MTIPQEVEGFSLETTAPTINLMCLTYSSALEDGQVVPSRLSRLAFDAALKYAHDLERQGEVPRIIIAGEQSYSTHPVTTGEALLASHATNGADIHLVPDPGNRLLNTLLQTEAVIEWLDENGSLDIPLATVAWKFHRPRIVDYFRWNNISLEPAPTVEDIIDDWHDRSEVFRQRFQSQYGFSVDWPAVRDQVQTPFERREYYTWLIGNIGRGAFLRLYSSLTKRGRYDDIAHDGRPILARTH